MLKKLLVLTFGVVVPLILIFSVFVGYNWVFENNVALEGEEGIEILVYKKDSPQSIYKKLLDAHVLKNEDSFILVAKQKKWSTAKTGRYIVKPGMSNNDLINMFRAGLQTPVNLVLNNLHSVADFAGKAAAQLMLDSATIFDVFVADEFLKENQVNFATVRSLIVPNTYEMYWNISPEGLRERLVKEYKLFWNETRIAQAKAHNLSPLEVATLASIVQKETSQYDEMPIVAGLYLNRLNKNIKLQSDPTVIYAKQLQASKPVHIKRVLYEDLKIDSPYNTYKYTGLPPAPITIATVQAINAVLNPARHNYIYMCANPENPGYHSFAASLREHNINKQKYVRWLEANNIKR